MLPHEGIYPAQADDLADRMAEMRLNPAPILLVHRATPRLRALLAEAAPRPRRTTTSPTAPSSDTGSGRSAGGPRST